MNQSASRKRLAIIGGGSSGLITLKHALDMLPAWEVICFEKSAQTIGCWGNPYPGFVSTSTKYTTQFACFPKYEAAVQPDEGVSREEFFCDDQYGRYLEEFARAFSLQAHISLQTRVERIDRDEQGVGWHVTSTHLPDQTTSTEHFDHVIVCSGLAAEPKPLDCEIDCLSIAELNHPAGLGHIRERRIVVSGGGESAVDFANRLAGAELGNQVFLSLQGGIRVSPRYHPIRGVPSDFLRNRLMLSIHEDLRNRIGQWFVEARIRYQEAFEWLFPGNSRRRASSPKSRDTSELQKEWAYRLTKAAKANLFDMFHNKSDDFLEAVADGRITIIGSPTDRHFHTFHQFDREETLEVAPDLVVPAVGYRSTLSNLFVENIQLPDFYQGCCHVVHDDLYLIGFARPIIGNIPTISEVQARYVCGLLAGRYDRPARIEELHRAESARRAIRFEKLNQAAVYPVEMFPYCDQLARQMHCFPSRQAVGSLALWWHMQLAPATTIHYHSQEPAGRMLSQSAPIYMPATLIGLLLALKPVSWLYSAWERLRRR